MSAHAKPVGMKVIAAMVFIAGGSVLVGLASWINVPSPAGLPQHSFGGHAAPGLVIVRVERLPREGALREQLFLLDPSPLFMPARESSMAATMDGGEGGRVVDTFAPALRFYPEVGPARQILRPTTPAEPAAAARQLAATRWFSGMARSGEEAQAVPRATRAARVDVYLMGNSERLAAVDMAEVEGLVNVAWRPLVLSVLVDTVGSIAPPAVVVSSGMFEVDERFRSIVGRELLPTLLLRPGVYRFEVGP